MSINWPEWNDDLDKFKQGVQKFTDDYKQYGDDQTAYKANVEAFSQFIKTHTPEEALLYFFAWIATATNPHQHDNILGLYDDQTTNIGNQLSGNARSTQLTNDIQNLMNDTMKDVDPGNQVKVAYEAIDELKKLFSSDAVGHMFANTKDSILARLDDYKSTLDTYFGPGKLSSFKDMIDKMSQKGDPDNAVEANKAFTDTSQILTSVTQNFSAALNQQVSEVTGMVKNWQSFLGSLMKSLLDETNSLIQNLSKG